MIMKSVSKCCMVLTMLAAMLLAAHSPLGAEQNTETVLSIHLVHQKYTQFTDPPASAPEGYRFVPSAIHGEIDYLVETKPVLADANFAEVTAGFDQYTGTPVVDFRLTEEAAHRFAEITRDNIGRAMAIVIDGKVVSAPVIQSEIGGGVGVITGSFSDAEVKDLVARMTGKPAN